MGTTLADVALPNALWCADFKGEFRLGDREYCYPLTVTDQASRFILMCEALQSTREDGAFATFQRLFQERGLPDAIRTDNGLPFASPNGLYNLSRLSVWWLRLGIASSASSRKPPERPIERMHLTLKTETTRPPGMNSLQQQARSDDFVREFNHHRPHEALAMMTQAEIYRTATRSYRGLPEIEYPLHDRDALVTACGRICMHRKKINISTVMAGQRLGLKEVDDGIWVVTFHGLRPGIYRLGTENTATYPQPVRHTAVTYVLGAIRHPCLRAGQGEHGGEGGISNPRYPCEYAAFRVRCFQPLSHLSRGPICGHSMRNRLPRYLLR